MENRSNRILKKTSSIIGAKVEAEVKQINILHWA